MLGEYELPRKDVEPITGDHDYMVKLHITKESLLNELQAIIGIHSDDGFVSYKNTLAFSQAFDSIVDKLEVVWSSGDKEYAVDIATEILKQLHKLETDDDTFPLDEAENVCITVDPNRTNQAFIDLLENWWD